jgi:hypothetical protein
LKSAPHRAQFGIAVLRSGGGARTGVQQTGLLDYVPMETRIPASHPLRAVRTLLD